MDNETDRAERCDSCRFHKQNPEHIYHLDCHRWPPAPVTNSRDQCIVGRVSVWPIVNFASWCGEWEETQEVFDMRMETA